MGRGRAATQLCGGRNVGPSIHNTQPWRFVARTGRLEVGADPQRRLPVLDPSARALHISCGAAATNILVTLTAAARAGRIRPMPSRSPLHVATVDVLGARDPSPADLARYHAIRRRHTSRQPFLNLAVSSATLDRLGQTAASYGVRLHVFKETERDRVLDLVRQAEHRQRRDHAYRNELSDWTAHRGQHRDDGVPTEAFGPWTAMENVPLRDFTGGTPIARQVARFENAPTVALITTIADQPRDWVRAGIALEMVWLDAVREGLSATPMTQPIELPDLRQDISTAWPTEHPQLLLRLGYGPGGHPTPRRDPETLLR